VSSQATEGPRAVNGALLIADITGYTSFLRDVQLAHQDDAFADGAVPDAYAMMSSLLDGIVACLVPPFELAKLEGDAVFVYAVSDDSAPPTDDAVACARACYADFRSRLSDARSIWQCWCDACSRVDTLDLKLVLHAGPFVIQELASGRELVGPEVVMAHRLLKTRATELTGHRAYVLVTAAAVDHFGVATDTAIPIVETYDHYDPIAAYVFPLVDRPSAAEC
jgi:hypothetical protein